jgi:hypothetical protein
MRKVAQLISYGESHFDSGTVNSQQFHDFFDLFKRSFTRELKSIGATKIELSKGHFYISGFFSVNEQAYYFSIDDVRHCFYRDYPKMLVRTAKDYKDYTGGSNNYFKIEPGMSKIMANRWGFTYKKLKPKSLKTATDIAQKIIDSEDGYHKFSVPSNKKAMDIMFLLANHFGTKPIVSTRKYGRIIDSSYVQNDKFEAYYYADTKRIRIQIKERLL